jgi:hypothetical protein
MLFDRTMTNVERSSNPTVKEPSLRAKLKHASLYGF